MANVHAVHSVGESLATALRHAYPADLRASFPCDFRLLSSGEMITEGPTLSTTLVLYLHRVTVSQYLRNMPKPGDVSAVSPPLPLDLHYLMISWASNAEAEHTILTWAMRQLYLYPVLDISSLSPVGNWTAGDTIQIIPAELSIEELMRVWDAFEAQYRLTVSYIARTVRVDPDTEPTWEPVVATRLGVGEREGNGGAR